MFRTAKLLKNVSALSTFNRKFSNEALKLNFQATKSANATKTPLVILHGLMGHLGNWRNIAGRPELNSDRDIYTVDLRNHGASPHSDVMTYEAMAADLAEFISNIGGNAVLIGHSMGGKAAMATALLHPYLLSGLVVVDISPESYPASNDEMRGVNSVLSAVNSVDFSNGASRSDVDSQLSSFITDLPTRQFIMTNLASHPPDETGAVLSWKPNVKILLEKYDDIRSFDLPLVPPFNSPTLFVRGERSLFVDPRTIHELASPLFSDIEVVTVAGAGHLVHAEKPLAFVQVLNTFLGKHGL